MFSLYSYDTSDLSLMPKREQISNKSTYGRLLCVCGSAGMCGAAYLSAKAAYRTGAGLVEILTASENLIPLQASLPEAIVTVYDSDTPDFNSIYGAIDRADAIVIGCGLGRSHTSQRLLSSILRYTDKPKVVDADALNIISEKPVLKKYLKGTVITPHPLEFSRLTGQGVDEVLADTPKAAYDFAVKSGAVCVLKTHATAVSDGNDRVYVNNSGNSGLATAGSGDVLAGIIGGILAQNKNAKLSPIQAASLGVYIHGLCGDIAAQALGEYSLMASDVIDALPRILKSVK